MRSASLLIPLVFSFSHHVDAIEDTCIDGEVLHAEFFSAPPTATSLERQGEAAGGGGSPAVVGGDDYTVVIRFLSVPAPPEVIIAVSKSGKTQVRKHEKGLKDKTDTHASSF